MKTIILFLFSIMLSSCYRQIGDLTMISSRNVDSKTEYKLIQKYVEGKAKTKNGRGLENAIDEAVKKAEGGEHMRNVKISIKNNGRKIKVEGDVWGISTVNSKVNKSVDANIKFQVGDRIMFKDKRGKIKDGKIVGLNQNTAIIEYMRWRNYIIVGWSERAKIELNYGQLTKSQ